MGLSGINIDITERKRAEAREAEAQAEAVRAEQTLDAALELSRVALWRWDTAADNVVWNGPVEEVLGKPGSELTNYAAFRTLLVPEDQEMLDHKLRASLETGIDFRAEFRIAPGGKVRWIASRGAPVRGKDQQIVGMSGANYDITATKRAEAGLIRSERELRQLADAMPQIVWTAKADGTVEHFNRRWYEYTGTTKLEDASAVIHPEDTENYQQHWREEFLSGQPFECEVRLRKADGSYRWHVARAVAVRNGAGAIERWFGTATDIESYKRLEAEIRELNRDLKRRVEEHLAQLAESERSYRMLVESGKGPRDFHARRAGTDCELERGCRGAQGVQGI